MLRLKSISLSLLFRHMIFYLSIIDEANLFVISVVSSNDIILFVSSRIQFRIYSIKILLNSNGSHRKFIEIYWDSYEFPRLFHEPEDSSCLLEDFNFIFVIIKNESLLRFTRTQQVFLSTNHFSVNRNLEKHDIENKFELVVRKIP